jgi:two-component system cell cycle sensor histidine kinase/response regulator CckA
MGSDLPFLRALFESALDAILVLDDERRCVEANPAARALFGLEDGGLVGCRLDEFVGPEVAAALDDRWRVFLERGTGTGEMRIRRRDASVRDVEMTSRANFIPGRHLSIVRDITEQKAAEEALQASEERFYIAFNANPHPMCIVLLQDGVILEVNESFLEVAGYGEQEVLGRTAGELRLWARPEDWIRVLALIGQAGTVRDFETELRTKAGEARVMLVAAERIDLDGARCVLLSATDVTERKRLEAQLMQSQRLESVGRLAGGVAHDFNNLLTVISGYSEFVLRRLPGGDPIRRDVEEIRRAGRRASELTQQLLAYSRKQVLRPKVLDLNVAVAEMSKMLVRLLGDDVELGVHLDPALWSVMADPGQIEQVIANLAVNARDAMPEGGSLAIETANAEVGEAAARANLDARPGDYAVLSVTDTGAGMDAETLPRIFEPFFTTKEPGRGTGLGLATVYGIVRQSGGWIDVASAVGRGTTFRIYLPRAAEEVFAPSRAPVPDEPPYGEESVLVVEDQPEVRRLVAEMLSHAGYTVLEASDGVEALAVLDADGAEVALVVTDVVMPRMSGRQLAERLAEARPDVRVLFMSGHDDRETAADGDRAAFLPKPFSPDSLARKVREVLDG